MMGENIRDNQGNLTAKNRGFSVGTHTCIAATGGSGKSTFLISALSYGLHLGYPCHRIVVIDSDNAVYNDNRLKKLTKLPLDVIEEKFTVVETTSPTDIAEVMKEVDEDYREQKFKPVKFPDPLNPGKEIKMMPYVVLVVDTVTSIKSSVNDVGGDRDVVDNTVGLTTNRELTEFIKSATNYCDGNIILVWVAHVGANKAEIGKYVAERDFKSAPIDKKIKIPYVLKGKISSAFVLEKVVDAVDRDKSSNGHIISRLNLNSETNAYTAQGRMWKSRTGTEGSTITELVNIGSEFDRFSTLVTDCENMGVYKKSGGMYPSADNPHIFRESTDADEEKKYMSTYKKQALEMEGWDRPFNIMEAYALVNYTGSDEKLIELRNKFTSLSLENLEKKLRYELEVNNVGEKELSKYRSSLGLFMHINKINKASESFNPNTDNDDSKPMIENGMEDSI